MSTIAQNLLENLVLSEYEKSLVQAFKDGRHDFIQNEARTICEESYGNKVFVRGLVEFSNYCSINCHYCGIRRDNDNVERYRMNKASILASVEKGLEKDIKTFVLQGGEDPAFTAELLADIVSDIKHLSGKSAAVTLSCGIKSKKDYELLKNAGVNRYLIRFETSDPELHKQIRDGISLERRLQALLDLRDLGFEVGSGYMTGLPGETDETRLNNALLCKALDLDMVGIGPFIPHPETPLGTATQEKLELAIQGTAMLRALLPKANIPATTAAGSLEPDGREQMLWAGANVLMPNMTPVGVKKDYLLYPGKICLDEEGSQCIGCQSMRVKTIGKELSFDRGNSLNWEKRHA